jgi:cyclase
MFKKSMALVLLSSLALTAVFAHTRHEDNQDVTVKTIKITDNVYMLQGQGGNIGVSTGAEGILIIDDDYAEVSPKIAEALKTLGSEKPRFIFNTHWHGDHTQGNKFFGKDSLILAHTNVRKRLLVDATILGQKSLAYPASALPVITYDDSISIHFNNEDIRAVHYPNGHTDGDSVIFFAKSNVVHLGDDFFVGKFPFVDLDSGGSVQGMAKNVGELIKILPADVKIIPGHGALATLNDLKAYHQMMLETMTHVKNGMKAGKSLEGLKKDGLPDKYKEWGTGFIKPDFWIETVYKSLSTKME